MSKYTDFTVKNYEKIIRNLEKIQRHVKYMSKIEKYVKKDLVGGVPPNEIIDLNVGSVLREKDKIELYVVSNVDKLGTEGVMIRQILKAALPTDQDNPIYNDRIETKKFLNGDVLGKANADADVEANDTDILISNEDLVSDKWEVVGSKKQPAALKTMAGFTDADAPVGQDPATAPVAQEMDRGDTPIAAAASVSENPIVITDQPVGEGAAATAESEDTTAASAIATANPAAATDVEDVPLEQANEEGTTDVTEIKANETLYKDDDGKMYLVKASVVQYNTEPNNDTKQWVVMDLESKDRVNELKPATEILGKSMLNEGEKNDNQANITELQTSPFVETPEDRAIKTGISVVKLDLNAITNIAGKIDQLLETVKNAGQKETDLTAQIDNLTQTLIQRDQQLADINSELEALQTRAASGASPEEAQKIETLEKEKDELKGNIADLNIQLEAANKQAQAAQAGFAELTQKFGDV